MSSYISLLKGLTVGQEELCHFERRLPYMSEKTCLTENEKTHSHPVFRLSPLGTTASSSGTVKWRIRWIALCFEWECPQTGSYI